MSKLLQYSISSVTRISQTNHIIKSDICSLTQRLSCIQLSTHSFHSSTANNEKISLREQQRNALALEKEYGIRSRCAWTKEEDELLFKLYNEHGGRWSYLSKQFVSRPPAHCANRYHLLTKGIERGPWSKDEVEKLKKACMYLPPDSDRIDWDHVQSSLPNQRPMYLIKQKYAGACDPTIKMGRWSVEESDKLRELVSRYGTDDMEYVSRMMGNRSRRQCMERWRWQMASMKKGRYTKEEDEAILKAVEKYGENFAVVAKVINSDRTPRHISQHYRNLLAPDVDRSPWTLAEEEKVYKAFLEGDCNMSMTKKKLKSMRSIRDLWNHVRKMKRQASQNNVKVHQVNEMGGEQVIKQEEHIDRV